MRRASTKALCTACLGMLLACAVGARDAGESGPLQPDEDEALGAPDTTPSPEADWLPPTVVFPPERALDAPFYLSELGLYRDLVEKRLAPDLIAYEPRYPLFSDGATKRRWLRLPAGAHIDTSDPEHFQFPIGTVFFKEFARDGKLLETRVIARLGPDPDDTFMGSFAWQEDELDAVLVPDGAQAVRGTDYDLPTQKNCKTCHRGEPGRILGFSALQGVKEIADLASQPLPSLPPAPDDLRTRALGYLHANCGHCHNEQGTARSDTTMLLRWSLAEAATDSSEIERNTLRVALDSFTSSSLGMRIVPGSPELSALVLRMQQRGTDEQMPTLGTKRVDDEGVALISTWIATLK